MSRAHEVMPALARHYRTHGLRATGTFACEIYAAKRSDAWLSPSYQEDMLRVDIFWFKNNPGDPVEGYFPQFWKLLAPFEFRSHWGKHLPPARGAFGWKYHRERYPKWDDFMEARQEFDPDNVFLSDYWRLHLGVDEQASTQPGGQYSTGKFRVPSTSAVRLAVGMPGDEMKVPEPLSMKRTSP